MTVSELGRKVTGAEQGSEPATDANVVHAVAAEVRAGLLAQPRTLSPWLFYDEAGSRLFEAITDLPEYYLTRAERSIFRAHAAEIVATAAAGQQLTVVELGAGTAAKTGLLLQACLEQQREVVYQPIDVSASALEDARRAIQRELPGVLVRPRVANYITEPFSFLRSPGSRTLVLYIGSSIGNFSPEQAQQILLSVRRELKGGDSVLLGTDLAPGESKSVEQLVAAYDDAAGVTAAFNRNVLTRLNRDLGSDFDPACFAHRALWNGEESRMEMHLLSLSDQSVHVPANSAGPALTLSFARGESIHTENSYKFTGDSLAALVGDAGFRTVRTWHDAAGRFAVTLAAAV